MAGISGKDGSVLVASTPVAEITKWTFNAKSNNPAWASSDSAGYKKRVAGVKDGSGSIEMKYDPSNSFLAQADVGTSATLKLYINATKFFSVPAIFDSYDFEVDLDDGDVVGVSADFSANGAWTNPV
jgi:hypothetical protein